MGKTNAMRALESAGIPYSVFEYDDSIHSASAAAQALGVDPGAVFKTLVVVADGRRLLVMAPGDRELDLRVVARSVGAKSARMASQREAEQWTQLKVGGISPLALLGKRFETFLDESGNVLEYIYINGGRRGLNVRLQRDDLTTITEARVIRATA